MVLDCEGQHGGDVLVRAGPDDGVGCVGEVTGPHAEQVGRRLAAGAQPAGLVVDEHMLGAQHLAQGGQQRRGQPGGRQRRGVEGRVRLEGAEGELDQSARAVGERRLEARIAPARGVHLGLTERKLRLAHMLQCDT